MQERLKGKKVAIIGLGISNIAVISYLLKQDISGLAVFDTRTNPPYADELPGGVDFHLGPLNAQHLKQFDMLVVSPGLSIHLPEIAEAAKAGAEIVGDIELFAGEAKAPVVGITGSNGKSTVTALVGFMLEKAGRNVVVGANFGHPVFDILSDRVEDYVLELSSFELETTSSLQIEAGVILNVSEDHLDRYDGSIETYAEAKQRIYTNCNKIVVNRDDPRTCPKDPELKKKIFATFGLDNSDYGREVTANTVYLTIKGQRVLDVREMIICGTHNELNALAAMALADAMGIPRDVQIQALKNFSGLEHRCQLVRVLDGVSFYNDSKATNVASAEAAISGLCNRHKEGIILLAGGIGKGQDFTPLKKYIGKEVSHIFCFGRDSDKIFALDPERCVSVMNMRQAIRMAFEIALPGQAILLSPACSSFDQFKGFDERGRVFANIVNNLTNCNQANGCVINLDGRELTPAQIKTMKAVCEARSKYAAQHAEEKARQAAIQQSAETKSATQDDKAVQVANSAVAQSDAVKTNEKVENTAVKSNKQTEKATATNNEQEATSAQSKTATKTRKCFCKKSEAKDEPKTAKKSSRAKKTTI